MLYPFHDRVHYELGRSYFNVALDNLADPKLRIENFERSFRSFAQALRLNPASFAAHFHFGQTLQYMSGEKFPFEVNYHDEYRKAAYLTGHNDEVYYEVGKRLLARWPSLSADDKSLTLDILKKILLPGERAKELEVMNIWNLNAKDYDVLEKLLPEDAESYYAYGQFLGERSLSIEKRKEVMARAEYLLFEQVKSECQLAGKELELFRLEEAWGRLLSCLEKLHRIRFYQDLTGQKLISLSEFERWQKQVFLNLAKCKIEQTRKFEEAQGYLVKYLELEDSTNALSELEAFLQQRAMLDERLTLGSKNLSQFSFQILLNYKQNRYKDITRLGNALEQSVVIIPEEQKSDYVRVLQLVGDSFEKLDYLYESEKFYKRALDVEPENMIMLDKLRRNYDRLNDEEKKKDVEEKIRNMLTRNEVSFENLVIPKGQSYSYILELDGRSFNLGLAFADGQTAVLPLISVLFNGKLIWEDYVQESVLALNLDSRFGENLLQVLPVNGPVSLAKMEYNPLETENRLLESVAGKNTAKPLNLEH
jgi:hypothetical protein